MNPVELLIEKLLLDKCDASDYALIDSLLANDPDFISQVREQKVLIEAIESVGIKNLKVNLDAIHKEVLSNLANEESDSDPIVLGTDNVEELLSKFNISEFEPILRSNASHEEDMYQISLNDIFPIGTLGNNTLFELSQPSEISLDIQIKNNRNEIAYSKVIEKGTHAFRISFNEFSISAPGTYIFSIGPTDWKLSDRYNETKGLLFKQEIPGIL